MTEGEIGYPALLGDGTPARAVGLAGEVMLLVTERPYPPGRPLVFSLQAKDDVTVNLQGKAAGSKLRADGRFDVKVKLNTVRREARAVLAILEWP